MRTNRRSRWAAAAWAAVAVACAWVALVQSGVQLPGANLLAGTAVAAQIPAADEAAIPATPDGTSPVDWAAAVGDPGVFHPTAEDVDMATLVLTAPDEGTPGRTVRWAGPEVTYRISLDASYPAEYVAMVHRVMDWAGTQTGLRVREVTGPAQIEVVPKAGNGALVTANIGAHDELVSVRFELGCCRTRPVWEDGLQAFGPLGDHADSRSVFSGDHERLRPGAFDAWVLRSLYRIPAGATPAQVRATLASTN